MANRRFVSRAPKRRTFWDGAAVDMSDLVVGTAQFATIQTEALLENAPNPTIVRTRGKVAAFTDASATPGGFGIVHMGMILVTATAFAASAIPLPFSQIGNDWLWWDQAIIGADASDVIGSEITVDRVVVDSKAMRKVGLNQVLVFVAELQTCEGVMVANVCGSIRVLFKIA